MTHIQLCECETVLYTTGGDDIYLTTIKNVISYWNNRKILLSVVNFSNDKFFCLFFFLDYIVFFPGCVLYATGLKKIFFFFVSFKFLFYVFI